MKDYMTLIISIVSFFITLFNFVLFYSNYSVNIVPIMDLENERRYFSLYNEGNRKINSMDTNLDINIDIAYTIYDKKEYEEKGEKANPESRGDVIIPVKDEFIYKVESVETVKEIVRYNFSNTLRLTQAIKAIDEVVSTESSIYIFKSKGQALYGEVSYVPNKIIFEQNTKAYIFKKGLPFSGEKFNGDQLFSYKMKLFHL